MNLTKAVKDQYIENYKTLKKEQQDIQINGNLFHRLMKLI